MGGTGEEGRGRGEGRLTKETSCCLHTNPKLIMSGGAGGGAEKCLGRSLCQLKSLPRIIVPLPPPPPTLCLHRSHPAVHLLLGLQQRRAGRTQSWSSGPFSPRLKSSPSGHTHPDSSPREARRKGRSLIEPKGVRRTWSWPRLSVSERLVNMKALGVALSAWNSGEERNLPNVRPGRVLRPWGLPHRAEQQTEAVGESQEAPLGPLGLQLCQEEPWVAHQRGCI